MESTLLYEASIRFDAMQIKKFKYLFLKVLHKVELSVRRIGQYRRRRGWKLRQKFLHLKAMEHRATRLGSYRKEEIPKTLEKWQIQSELTRTLIPNIQKWVQRKH